MKKGHPQESQDNRQDVKGQEVWAICVFKMDNEPKHTKKIETEL